MSYGDLWWAFFAGWGVRSALSCLWSKKALLKKAEEHEWAPAIGSMIFILAITAYFAHRAGLV